ncbi:MAG: type II secretion system F family protein [Selenomonadaceae bacterium]|nr:type II secretion system F family protein [Selenomonadaceae bacterium]
MLKLLFAISVSVFVFLLIAAYIRKLILPSLEVQERMRGISQHPTQNTQTKNDVPQTRIDWRRRAAGRNLADIPFSQRVFLPLMHSIERFVRLLAPAEISAMIERKLVLAGLQYKWTPGRVIVIMLILGTVTLTAVFYRLYNSDMLLIQKIVLAIISVFSAAAMPIVILNIKIQNRQKKIFYQLPEVLDLLSVSVEAGLSFDGALRRIVDRMTGPLVDECKKLMGDIRMGMIRRTALQKMAERCDVDEVSLFVTSIIQAERLGTSMGRTLKIQADNVRERHRQYVRALALKAPVKIVFPLVFFIFPALLIVALGPPLITITQRFLGGH